MNIFDNEKEREVDRKIAVSKWDERLAAKLRELRKSKNGTRYLVASITYFLLIIVVIYGAFNYVYTGFGPAAPWVVGAIFLAMAIIRAKNYLDFRAKLAKEPKDDGSGRGFPVQVIKIEDKKK